MLHEYFFIKELKLKNFKKSPSLLKINEITTSINSLYRQYSAIKPYFTSNKYYICGVKLKLNAQQNDFRFFETI